MTVNKTIYLFQARIICYAFKRWIVSMRNNWSMEQDRSGLYFQWQISLWMCDCQRSNAHTAYIYFIPFRSKHLVPRWRMPLNYLSIFVTNATSQMCRLCSAVYAGWLQAINFQLRKLITVTILLIRQERASLHIQKRFVAVTDDPHSRLGSRRLQIHNGLHTISAP